MSAFGNAGNNLMNLFLVEHIRELQKTAIGSTMKNGLPFWETVLTDSGQIRKQSGSTE